VPTGSEETQQKLPRTEKKILGILYSELEHEYPALSQVLKLFHLTISNSDPTCGRFRLETRRRDIDTIPAETMDSLTRYSWPGNIRALQNIVERAVILSPGNVLHVPLEDLKHRSTSAITLSSQTVEETERAHILAVPEKTQWKLSGPNGAAARLGLHRTTLQFRMKKLGIVRSM
jgi:transcriptional regulator of acetoin/glycerol metabolism